MTRAVFWEEDGRYIGFDISGHSMRAEAGSDIVCAAVSAMTMLVVNTIREVYGTKAKVFSDTHRAVVSFMLEESDGHSSGLIGSFLTELQAVAQDYPENLSISVKNISKRSEQQCLD